MRGGGLTPLVPPTSHVTGGQGGWRSIPPWGPGSMDRHPPHPLQKSRRGQGSSPHTQRPRRHTESEPGEPAGPPRTLKSISLASALGGVLFTAESGDIRAKPTRTRETGQPGGGPFGVWGDVLRGGPLPAVSSPRYGYASVGGLYQRARPHMCAVWGWRGKWHAPCGDFRSAISRAL